MTNPSSVRAKRYAWAGQLRRLATRAAALTLYPLSRLSPRSSRHWAFGHAGDKFTGNPKYLFLWMTLHRKDIKVTWLTGSEEVRLSLAEAGFRACKRWSAPGIVAALRAKVFVFGHGLGNVNAPLSGGAYLLNLWHGVGLKAIHLGWSRGKTALASQQTSRNPLARLMALEYLRPYDALVTTSDMMQAHFSQQMQLPPERCPQLGYPRLDCAVDPELADLVQKLDRRQGFMWNAEGFTETYIYMPTYRDTGRPFLNEALPDLARLSAILEARKAVLYVKPHPDTPAQIDERLTNIRRWDDRIDVNAYLDRFDGLITDYSSVLYDFLATRDTGAILYIFDLAEYLAQDRTFMFPFEENVAGARADSFDALCDLLASGRALTSEDGSQVPRIRDRFWGGSSSPASPAVVSYVEAELGRKA